MYIIPTPIGNMGDITLRALEVLKTVDVLLCEDTRRTRKLLSHYAIKVPKIERFCLHTEVSHQARLLARLESGEQAGLVCDAGTPGICDVAYTLVKAMQENNLKVCCLPGATALIPALICSGLPPTPFYFGGFLPHKKGRKAHIEWIKEQKSSCVLYESPHRLLKTLKEMGACLGEDKELAISREISKWHEEHLRGTIGKLIDHFEKHAPRGEFVLVYNSKTT